MSDIVVRDPDPNPQHTPNDGAPTDGQAAQTAGRNAIAEIDPEEILRRAIGWFKTARDHWQEWRQDASECYDFVAGTQWSDEDLEILRDQMRPAVTFNRIGPFVDVIGGLEINNRQETQYIPRQLGAAGVNELLTGAAKWVRDECDAEDEESEAFRDAAICGLGYTQTLMDYDEDPDGMAQIVRIDPLEMYPDPGSRKQNLADARYLMRVKDLPLETAEEAFPAIETEDLHAQWAEDQPDETRSPHNARLAPYYRIDQAGEIDRSKQMVRMVELEWWDFRPAWRVVDPQSGRFVRLNDHQAQQLVVTARLAGQIPPELLRDRCKKWYKAVIGARVLRITNGPEDGGFTYKAITGRRDRNKGTWYGVVRAMRDPQVWANKFFSQMLHIVNTNAKGGLIAEEDAFVDPDEARDAWAESDSIIMLNPGKIEKVIPKPAAPFPAAIPQMMQVAIEAITATSGINQEMIAQADQVQPGVLEMQRKQQGMTVLATLFNAFRRYRKEQGRLLLWFIQAFISDGRLIRIGGAEDRQYVPLVHQPGVGKYDVVVDDAPSSPSMKDKAWSAMMQLFPILARLNPPPQMIAEALKYAPLPVDFVAKVSQLIAQSENRPPPPQVQVEMEVQKAKAGHLTAQANKANAEAQAIPSAAQGDAAEQSAHIEQMRAAALNDLQNASLAPTQATLDALDTRLRVNQQLHDQVMDVAQMAQPSVPNGAAGSSQTPASPQP